MRGKFLKTCLCFLSVMLFAHTSAEAFWIFTPRDKKFVNPKHAVKDSPEEQFEWAMRFYNEGDFKSAGDEFVRLTENYRDSTVAPEAQYYAARSFEEQGRYWFAFQNYKKTIENYPYTRRMDEIIERLYNIGNMFESLDTAKLMGIELSLSMERAVESYQTIIEASPFSTYADNALYRIGEVSRRIRKYPDAMEAYARLISDYPDSPLMTEARYQLALTKYEASLEPEYDQESTERALAEFKEIIASSPEPVITQEANQMLRELRERKAESSLNIAQFYDRQGKHGSAKMYYESIVGKFPETSAAQYAAERIKKIEERKEK